MWKGERCEGDVGGCWDWGSDEGSGGESSGGSIGVMSEGGADWSEVYAEAHVTLMSIFTIILLFGRAIFKNIL